MRSPIFVAAIAATVVLAGCDDSSFSHRMVAPDRPSSIYMMQPQWTVTRLNFRPRGINDAGFVVGSMGDEAVRWGGGSLTLLLHVSQLVGYPQTAVAITPLGQIIGYTDGGQQIGIAPLKWASPMTPQTLAFADGYPSAMNDNGAIIVNTRASGLLNNRPWLYTATLGWVDLARRFTTRFDGGRVYGMNRSGYFVGTVMTVGQTFAVRFDQAGRPTVLSNQGFASGAAINSRGDVLGWAGATAAIWGFDGIFTQIPGIPNASTMVGWNDAGRIVGNDVEGRAFTFMNGVLTYLPLLDTTDPVITGVNSCGWIIGVGAGDVGYLWKRVGATTPVCDDGSTPPAM